MLLLNAPGWIVFRVARPDPRPSRPSRVPSCGPAIAAASTRARHESITPYPSNQRLGAGFSNGTATGCIRVSHQSIIFGPLVIIMQIKWTQQPIDLNAILVPIHRSTLMVTKMQDDPILKRLVWIRDIESFAFCFSNGIVEIMSRKIITVEYTPNLIILFLTRKKFCSFHKWNSVEPLSHRFYGSGPKLKFM
jgi:hypothetical protein